MQNDGNIIQVKNLGKYFGHIKAVDDISFEVKMGEVLGFLGPNGAGKSTTMKMLTCFLSPDFGSAQIQGHDIINSPFEIKKIIGYLPENAPAYEDMTVLSFFDFIADIRELSGIEKKEKIEKTFELVSLNEVAYQSIGTLSKGYKRRVGLAQAILHDPLILILDEPTDGLDPNQKHEVRELIRKMSKEKVIILSTHILEEVDEVCSRAIIISKGKIVADGTPNELKTGSHHYRSIHLVLEEQVIEAARSTLEGISEIENIDIEKMEDRLVALNIFPKNKQKLIDNVINLCNKNSWTIHGLSIHPGNLSEVFRNITSNKGDS